MVLQGGLGAKDDFRANVTRVDKGGDRERLLRGQHFCENLIVCGHTRWGLGGQRGGTVRFMAISMGTAIMVGIKIVMGIRISMGIKVGIGIASTMGIKVGIGNAILICIKIVICVRITICIKIMMGIRISICICISICIQSMIGIHIVMYKIRMVGLRITIMDIAIMIFHLCRRALCCGFRFGCDAIGCHGMGREVEGCMIGDGVFTKGRSMR